MKAQYINPFIESINSVFELMLNTHLERQSPRLSTADRQPPASAVASIIGITGQANGCVALCFPAEPAIELASRFLGVQVRRIDDEAVDALAELANMVAGSAKSKFDLDPPPKLSLPTVVIGRSYEMKRPTSAPWIEIPFCFDAGAFTMNVSFDM